MAPGSAKGPAVVLLAAAMLAGPLAPATDTARAQSSTPDQLVIDTEKAQPTVAFEAFDNNPVKLYDIDRDGDEEIVAQNDNQWVYVFDSRTGELLFETTTRFPEGWGARSFNGPEVSIVREGGATRLIVANSAAVITSLRFDPGASSASEFTFVKEWDRRLNGCFDNPGMDAKPVLADLDRDGTLEILGATEERGLYALRADGSLFWRNCLGGGNAAPAVADLDRDGFLDVVHASDGGTVSALDGRSGAWMWGYSIRAHFNVGTGSIPVKPGVGQLDGRGGPDVVVGARDSHNTDNFDANHALLLALSSKGNQLWADQHPEANPLTYTRPVVVDADEDGTNEVYWGDWNTIGHKPPPPDSPDAWAVTGPANFYRYAADGQLDWRQTLNTYWSNKDVALADVTGDGRQNVLANGPSQFDGIWYLDASTGDKVRHVSTHPWKVSRGPVVEDLWGTGTTQWVAPVQAATTSVSGGAIFVHDTGVAFDAAWPHLPDPQLRDSPPPAQDTGETTFTIKNPNDWWQEVFVEPGDGRTITDTKVRIDGGSWLPMTLRDWGAWTSSFNTPAGSQVEFRASASDGTRLQSEPFTWLDGTLTRGSVDATDPDPDPSPFAATFEVADGVNEWWVEAAVGGTESIATVDARVNGGDWIGLSKTSWGTWAKSFNVPAGSQVEFRATSVNGQTAVSQTFTWLADDSPPPTGFTASFSLSSNVNNWWVEVSVEGSSPVAGVTATVDGSDPVKLSKTSWGTWAKSFHVPTGSQVAFQATDGAGSSASSQTFTWP